MNDTKIQSAVILLTADYLQSIILYRKNLQGIRGREASGLQKMHSRSLEVTYLVKSTADSYSFYLQSVYLPAPGHQVFARG